MFEYELFNSAMCVRWFVSPLASIGLLHVELQTNSKEIIPTYMYAFAQSNQCFWIKIALFSTNLLLLLTFLGNLVQNSLLD